MSQVSSELGQILNPDNFKTNLVRIFDPSVLPNVFGIIDADGIFRTIQSEMEKEWEFSPGAVYEEPKVTQLFDGDLRENAYQAGRRAVKRLPQYLVGALDTDEATIGNLPGGTFITDRVEQVDAAIDEVRKRLPFPTPDLNLLEITKTAGDLLTEVDITQLVVRGYYLEALLKLPSLALEDFPTILWVVAIATALAEERIDTLKKEGKITPRQQITPDQQAAIKVAGQLNNLGIKLKPTNAETLPTIKSRPAPPKSS